MIAMKKMLVVVSYDGQRRTVAELKTQAISVDSHRTGYKEGRGELTVITSSDVMMDGNVEN